MRDLTNKEQRIIEKALFDSGKTIMKDDIASQMKAQAAAQTKARWLQWPIDDGYGSRHYPPNSDGLPIIGPTPKEKT